MICKLCFKEKELCDSHIIPKFVSRWMKKTGSGRLRIQKDFNKPRQDIIHEKLLCKECEAKFSYYETLFSKKIFYPYLQDEINTISINSDLNYFIVSVLWRVLVYFKDDGNSYTHKEDLDSAEFEWRNNLYNDIGLVNFNNFHLVFTGNLLKAYEEINGANIIISDTELPDFAMPNTKIELYLKRSVDMEIIESDHSTMIYAKFSKFLLLGEIKGDFKDLFIGTNIKHDVLVANEQFFTDLDFLQFVYSRAMAVKEFSDLSENQKKLNGQYFEKNQNDILQSEYWKIISNFQSHNKK